MTRTPVNSNHLRSVGHEPRSGTLEVEFMNGDIYQYENVPMAAYREIIQRPSPGHAFDSLIKSKPFRFTKVNDSANTTR